MRVAFTVIFAAFLSACATPEPLLPAKAAYRSEPVRVVQVIDWSDLDGLRPSFVLCGPSACPSATPKTRIDSLAQAVRPVLALAAPLPQPEISEGASNAHLVAAEDRQRADAEIAAVSSAPVMAPVGPESTSTSQPTDARADDRTFQVRFSQDSTRMTPSAIQALYAWIQHFEDVPIRYVVRISGPIARSTAERRLAAVHQALRAYGVPVFRLSSSYSRNPALNSEQDGKTVTVTVTAFAGFVSQPEQPAPAAYGSRGTLADERAADSDTSATTARSLPPSTLIQE